VYEVLVVDAAMRQGLVRDASEASIGAAAAAQGMVSLRGSALAKAARGETTYEEALRIT
jgi:type IV pilus assembly protein PilB